MMWCLFLANQGFVIGSYLLSVLAVSFTAGSHPLLTSLVLVGAALVGAVVGTITFGYVGHTMDNLCVKGSSQ